jgi:DNA polymerase-1
VPNKRYREGLLNHAEDARQSRELARIRTDVPVEFDPEALRFRGATREKCFELFTRLGFRSLVMEYAPTAETSGSDYRLVTTRGEAEALASELAAAGAFTFRVIPDAPQATRASIVGIAFSSAPRRATYVPVGGEQGGRDDLFGDAVPAVAGRRSPPSSRSSVRCSNTLPSRRADTISSSTRSCSNATE